MSELALGHNPLPKLDPALLAYSAPCGTLTAGVHGGNAQGEGGAEPA